jgi:spore coat protein U-like protein
MTKIFHLAAAAALSTFVAASPAFANSCANVSFSVPSFPQFDPINGNYVAQNITANFTRIDTNAVTARLILLDNDAGTIKLAAAGPIYDIKFGGATQVFPSGTALSTGNGALVTFSGTSASGTFSFTIPNTTTDFIGGSSFTEPLRYSVQCYKNAAGSGSGNLSAADSNVSAFSAAVTIAKQVTITTAGPQTINFGDFTTTTQTLAIAVKSTSSINVSVATANGSQMVLSGAVSPFPTNSSIPYTMNYAGTAVSSGSSLINQTRAGVAGGTRNLVLTLPALPSGKLAGTYSDTITLTLTPGI